MKKEIYGRISAVVYHFHIVKIIQNNTKSYLWIHT